MIPIYGFLEGDTLGLLILGEPGETIAALAEKVQRSARLRVPHRARVRVVHEGRTLDPTWTIDAAQIGALDRIDVRYDDARRGIR